MYLRLLWWMWFSQISDVSHRTVSVHACTCRPSQLTQVLSAITWFAMCIHAWQKATVSVTACLKTWPLGRVHPATTKQRLLTSRCRFHKSIIGLVLWMLGTHCVGGTGSLDARYPSCRQWPSICGWGTEAGECEGLSNYLCILPYVVYRKGIF